MVPIPSLLLIVVLSTLIARVTTSALIHTGLSREPARFQARSAFAGAEFTTTESENVVRHRVRRRIVMLLMLLGNAGIVTAIASLMLAFVGPGQQLGAPAKVAAPAAGVTLLWALSSSPWVEQRLSRLIALALARYASLDMRDDASLMHLAGEYQIGELQVDARDWLAGRALLETRQREEGVLVLGIEQPDGHCVGAPLPDPRIEAGDVLLVYCRAPALAELDSRRRGRRGDRAHAQPVAEQSRVAASGQDNRD